MYDERVVQLSVAGTAALCRCVFDGIESMAIFIGDALYMQKNVLGASCTTRRVAEHARRQLAGCPTQAGYRNGAGWNSRFSGVTDMAFSSSRNALIVCDSGNHCVRIVHLVSPYMVSTVSGYGKCAGYVDGNIKLAQFHSPYSVAVADSGDEIFVADYGNDAVRLINTLEGTVESIFGKMAATSFVGDADNEIHTVLRRPTTLRLAKNGRFLFVVNSGANSVCRLQIRLRAKPNEGRWVHVFACDRTQFALKTTIQAAGSSGCVVWRESSGTHEPRMSSMSLYNTYNGRILFHKLVALQPGLFFLCVSPSTVWWKSGGMGTICYSVHAVHLSLMRMCSQLRWDILRLLFLAMVKPDSGSRNTQHTFAKLSPVLLQLIIGFANDPFGVCSSCE
jgi:hypothetical protein